MVSGFCFLSLSKMTFLRGFKLNSERSLHQVLFLIIFAIHKLFQDEFTGPNND